MSTQYGRNNLSKVAAQRKRGALPSMNVLRLAANVADTETITINGTVFEIDTNAAVTSGRTAVDCSGGVTPALASVAIVTAINSVNCGMRAVKISDNEVLVYAAAGDATAYACTETLAGANNGWASATAFGGSGLPSNLPSPILVKRVPTAQEVTLQTMHFPLNFTPTTVVPQIRTSAGAIRAWDGAVTITGTVVTLASSGTTDIATDDVVCLLAV